MPEEWRRQLTEERLGHFFLNPQRSDLTVLGMIVRPEQDIENREILSEVIVTLLHFFGVVPPVDIGGDEYIVQNPAVHVYVAVCEQAYERGDRAEVYKYIPRYAHYKKEGYAEKQAAQGIDEMEPPGIEKPELLDAVVYGVETPQKIPGMGQAVLPVKPEFAHDHRYHDLNRHGKPGRPERVSGFMPHGLYNPADQQ